MRVKLCIFIMSLCVVYGLARFSYLNFGAGEDQPIQSNIIRLCKEAIKAVDPQKVLEDIGNGLNDVVDISKINKL